LQNIIWALKFQYKVDEKRKDHASTLTGRKKLAVEGGRGKYVGYILI
jgi:hypothetical protein